MKNVMGDGEKEKDDSQSIHPALISFVPTHSNPSPLNLNQYPSYTLGSATIACTVGISSGKWTLP